MNKYTSYRVDVRSSPEQQQQPQPPNNNNNLSDDVFQTTHYSAVLRRYSDFLWLYERFHKEKPGAIVPPIPDKQAVARFSASFIEDRRMKLEQFLRRVAVHPELYDAPSLDTFLRADDVTFHAAKNSKSGGGVGGQTQDGMMMSIAYPSSSGVGGSTMAASHVGGMVSTGLTAPKKDGIKKWFAETKTSIAGDLVRSPDDDLFLEIDRYVDRLEKQMKNVSAQASNLVKKSKEISNGFYEFGSAFNTLGQSEADELGNALMKMGSTADQLSNVTMEEAEKEMIEFEEPLKDYLKTIHAVKLALQRRHEKRLTYTTCLSEVNTKRTNLAKFRATPGAEAKAYGAEMSLKRGEAAADAARDEFATVSQRVLREVDRFKREKGDEMKHVVLEYVSAQIEYNKKMEQLWANLLPQLECLAVDSEKNVANSSNRQMGGGPVKSAVSNNGHINGTSSESHIVETEVEDMPQPPHPQLPHQQTTIPQPSANGPMYNASLANDQSGSMMGSSIQYRDMNAYPAYSNVPSS